ncbi:hypothetical protein GCM10018772_53730 [Streptomyces fumanus]|uniref:Uncharacterized protein n=1 Tax=Streptomyces fumanus TaxID=67302 RepID=A0A919AQC6_9ACTN|nr:hypothetical protein GCM10018772_53730 [Streptomyces fumanus]
MGIDSFGTRELGSGLRDAGRGGERTGRRGHLRGAGLTTPFAGCCETFGSYKAKRGARSCLHNYSDFLLSETATPAAPPRPAKRRTGQVGG